MPRCRFSAVLLVAVLAVLLWSGLAPHDRLTWLLEVAPAIAGIAILVGTRRRCPLVPIGNWVRDAFDLSRNHYDRLGHFAQGFVPAMIAREIFIRLKVVASARWRTFFIICVCLAISAVYELIEWTVAVVSGAASDAFLGTQGDPWDTQTDMALAWIGAILALALLSRWHDRQLGALPFR